MQGLRMIKRIRMDLKKSKETGKTTIQKMCINSNMKIKRRFDRRNIMFRYLKFIFYFKLVKRTPIDVPPI